MVSTLAMVTGVHFLLTYTCSYECDHCFLYCSPRAEGTFTLAQLRELFRQIEAVDAIDSIYLEGGEPFLFHPLMVAAARMAKERSLSVGIVTNGYWAMAEEDAQLWLQPLQELGLADLSVSDDEFHGGGEAGSPARIAQAAANGLGMPVNSICIESPTIVAGPDKGAPVVGGGAMLRGRAAETLVAGLPRQDASHFDACPHEELRAPGRVHVDPFGHVHLCQGIVIGNVWDTPLGRVLDSWGPEQHPIVGPLLRGGPAALAGEHDFPVDDAGYADACHLCYSTRKALLDRFPELLAPRQVYGVEAGG